MLIRAQRALLAGQTYIRGEIQRELIPRLDLWLTLAIPQATRRVACGWVAAGAEAGVIKARDVAVRAGLLLWLVAHTNHPNHSSARFLNPLGFCGE